jgi:hypothetical protein
MVWDMGKEDEMYEPNTDPLGLNNNPIYQETLRRAQRQRDHQDDVIAAIGPAVLAYGFYKQHQEQQAHNAYVDALPPVEQSAYYQRQSTNRLRGLRLGLIGVVILVIGIVGGHSLPGNGAVFNLVGIGLAFVGLSRAVWGRG